jgi:predicted P-loop ATPase
MYKCQFSTNTILETLLSVSLKSRFHPVRDYFNGLKWDGKPRIDTWLKDYLGAEGFDEYLSQVSAKVLCAIVARVFKPGTKFDYVLILEGEQGCGKSTAIEHLASREWYTDTMIDLKNKDSFMALEGCVIMELAELSSFKGVSQDVIKNFITSPTDKYRKPYNRQMGEYKRQCVFIGTTNDVEYLKDMTGNRRFWPVEVNGYDFKKALILRDRDQLFAEAKVRWENGEVLFLTGAAEAQAQEIQKDKAPPQSMLELATKAFFDKCDEDPVFEGLGVISEPFFLHELYDLVDYKFNTSTREDETIEKRRARRLLKRYGFKPDTTPRKFFHKVWGIEISERRMKM